MRRTLILLFALCVLGWNTRAHAYASAEIIAPTAHQYGRFEASIQFAAGSGVVCSFFLWKDGSEVEGTFWNELDFETVDSTCELKTNPYYGNPAQVHSQTAAVPTVCGAFHTFTYEWTPDYIAFLVDGAEVRRETGEAAAAYRDNTAGGMQLRFNIWPGDASFGGTFDPNLLPVYQYVDWVQYSSYDGSGFVQEWREDFDAGTLPAGWSLGTWDSPKGQSTHSVENAGVVDGVLVLALTADDAQGVPGASTTGAGGQGGTSTTGGATTGGMIDAGATSATGMGGVSSTGGDPAGSSNVGGATSANGSATTDGGSLNATATGGVTPTATSGAAATTSGAGTASGSGTGGTSALGGTDGSSENVDNPADDGSGCACRAPGSRSTSGVPTVLGGLALLALGAAFRVRRRTV
jgi:MYXO-CTERM domain-containing protein